MPWPPLPDLRAWLNNRYLGNSSITTYYALLEACLIGGVSALAALLLKSGIGSLGWLRLQGVQHFGVGSLLLFSTSLGLVAGLLIEYGSTAAKGSGIPQVKAALAQFPVAVSLRVALIKLVGTTLALGAGFTLGRRGPTVHIGAALAAQLSRWVPTSPQHRRQMIAAGAAAGLAAGFNTPIAGVLFVVEELSRDMSGLTLETAILASFTGSVISRLLGGSADLNLPATLLLTPENHHLFQAADIPFYVLLGIIAGGLGVLFNQGLLWGLTWNHSRISLVWRMGLAGLITGSLIAIAPPVFRDNAGLKEFLITGELGWQQTLLVFVLHFGLTLVAYGSGAPGGLFSPALVLGSALGYLMGLAKLALLGVGVPTPYTLVGMGAFFTAVARVPVTAIVIIFELTADFQLVLPLMISTALAYCVAEALKPGSIYQHLLKASGIDLSDEGENHDVLATLKASQVMQHQVETLQPEMTLQMVWQICQRSHHHGFPVVQRGQLVGMFTEQHLAKLSSEHPQRLIRDFMERQPIAVHPGVILSDVLYLMDRHEISHLPVTEGRRLVGIITRSDLIHATADQLRGQNHAYNIDPSYGVYRTREPTTGEGRILLPLRDAAMLTRLLPVVEAIAHTSNYEVECLHILTLPPHLSPAQTAVNLDPARALLKQFRQATQAWSVPIHTQIRVAHDIAQTILETIQARHIDLLIMDWPGRTQTTPVLFGDIVDTLLREAACDVVLFKPGQGFGQTAEPTPWLIPFSGGPNIQAALNLLPALAQLTAPEQVILPQIGAGEGQAARGSELAQAAEHLANQLPCPILPLSLPPQNIVGAIVQLTQAKNCGLVIVGASREGMVQHALHGNIPEAIASGVSSTVILFQVAVTH
ncbi:MAG: CBS domain-containing protein [Spirulina sp. SIO3F2]|nr:CBS domain-containing protein [Spirulina sp. SIO3F2]